MKKLVNWISTIVILTAFAGQSVASSLVHCQMAVSPVGQESLNLSSMDHQMHQSMQHTASGDLIEISQDDESSTAKDCCSLGSNCSMSSCSSVLALAEESPLRSQVYSERFLPLTIAAPQRLMTFLFRPPIFA